MRQEDRSAHLEQENVALRAELAAAYARLKRLEKRLAEDSHNSSISPSRDGVARQRQRHHKASEKKSGGQVGHPGHTLLPVATPNEVVSHRPLACQHCQQPLEGVPGEVKEHRQVQDLPVLQLVVREHQVEQVRCPACHRLSTGTFPAGVEAPVQYGPHVRALGHSVRKFQPRFRRWAGEKRRRWNFRTLRAKVAITGETTEQRSMGPVFNTPDAISAYYGLRPKPGWMYEAAKRIFEARLTGKPGRATIRGARSDWTAEGISLAGVASAWLIVLGSSSVNID